MSLVLLDQNVPRPLARFLTRHTVRTAADQGWSDLSDGDLLKAAEAGGFQCMVTSDGNIRYQQNLSRLTIGIVVLSTNAWPRMHRNISAIVVAVDLASPGSFREVLIPY